MTGIRKRITALRVAGGMLAAGALLTAGPAASAAATTSSSSSGPAITVKTLSLSLKKVSGDVYVIYKDGQYASADINASVTGLSTAGGEVVTLYGQQFPYDKPPVGLDSETIPPGSSTATFSNSVTPALATRYTADVYASSTSPTPVATSNVATVYVTSGGHTTGGSRCRPVCHEKLREYVSVPASALKDEMSKHNYPYFGLALDSRREPKPPKWLRLGAGDAKVTRARRISAGEFELTVQYKFRIGNDGYYWLWTSCLRDNEAKDGLNLPGHHGCGKLNIPSDSRYLG